MFLYILIVYAILAIVLGILYAIESDISWVVVLVSILPFFLMIIPFSLVVYLSYRMFNYFKRFRHDK